MKQIFFRYMTTVYKFDNESEFRDYVKEISNTEGRYLNKACRIRDCWMIEVFDAIAKIPEKIEKN